MNSDNVYYNEAFVDHFRINNFADYEFAINDINIQFYSGSQSQEEYAKAIHRLNGRMMATQTQVVAKHRMRLLRSHGTLHESERVYQCVPFNREEKKYYHR